jgi:sodium-dependent dicarboxylate transporter 2/3/5
MRRAKNNGFGEGEEFPFIRWAVATGIVVILSVVTFFFMKDQRLSRSVFIVGVCLTLWLSEVVPPYVPTVVLWALTPLLMQPLGLEFSFGSVLAWSADPVLALFLGGFTLSVAAKRYGLDGRIASFAVRLSKGNRLALLVLGTGVTAWLSMWMSNIAAAAIMIVAMRPLFSGYPRGDPFRRALLLGVAMGANFGGLATPVGTGPNALAIAEASKYQPVTFISWMAFALPLAIGLLTVGVTLLFFRFHVRGTAKLPKIRVRRLDRRSKAVLLIFSVTVLAWLTEPWHGAPSGIIALLSVAAFFGSGLLNRSDLNSIDWSTLALIAGGIGIGKLLEKSGLVITIAADVPWREVSPFVRLLVLCFSSAILSALMSNTATAALLIPIAGSIDPSPSTAILIAVAASMGIALAISTPANAMVYGEGVRGSDLFVPGLGLMILGCLLISWTGPGVLRLMGIP